MKEVRSPIKVVLASMDERSTSRMDTIFKIVFKGRCKFAEQIEDAHLGIVDLDSEINAWDKYQQQHPGLPAIVISATPVKIKGTVYIAKPVKLNLLWESVLELMTGLPPATETVGKTDPTEGLVSVDKSAVKSEISTVALSLDSQFLSANIGSTVRRTSMQDELYYNPDNYLLGRILSSLRNSIGKQCIIYVQCWRNRQLILIPDQNHVYTDLTDNQLKNLGVATLSEKFTVEINHVCNIGKNELPASETDGLQSMSVNYLIWDLAMRTARGRVPEGTDLSMSLYLQSWPNFTRLPHTPHGMRIASLWARNPRTLDDIAQSLDIDRSDVYSFYSAAVATGLTGSTTHQVDSLISPKKITGYKPDRRGLLASILRSISKKQ